MNPFRAKLPLAASALLLFAGVAYQPAKAAAPTAPQGVITAREYLNIGGTALAPLKSDPRFPDSPDVVAYPTVFEWPANPDGSQPAADIKNNYGVQIIGYLYPPTTGDYTFVIAADDNAELWLSTDDSPANKVRICIEASWNPVRAFAAETRRNKLDAGLPTERFDNISKPIRLTANRSYYIEALMKEGGGGDNLAVAWAKPGDPLPADGDAPIPGTFLATFDRPTLAKPYVAGFNSSPGGVRFTIEDGSGAGAATVSSSSVKLTFDGASVVAKATKSGSLTTVSYDTPALLASQSKHIAKLEFTDSAGAAQSVEKAFTVGRYAVLAPAHKVTPDTSKRGFLWRVHQQAAELGNVNIRTEIQLAGLIKDADGNPVPNLADPSAVGGADGPAQAPNPPSAPIAFEVSKVINFDQTAGSNGAFTPDEQMPGIPGVESGTDGIAAEIITYLELPAGLVTMGVNSDDGFRTSAGAVGVLADAFTPPEIAGEFSGGRGASDTIFTIGVQEAGVYAFVTIWEEGGGGANIEWFTVKSDGTKVLVNDDANGGVKAYRAASPTVKKAVARKLEPKPNSGGAVFTPQILAEIVDGSSPIVASTVSMKVDGVAVTASASKQADVTTVTFKPATPFAARSTHTVAITYTEGGSPVTREWQFTTQNNDLIAYWDFNDASDPSKAKSKVGGYAGEMLSGAKYTDDGKGRTGKPGDRAAKIGSEDPAVNGWIRVTGSDIAFMNAGGIQDQLAISVWQRLDVVRNSSIFWANGQGYDRAFQAHAPWSDNVIYFDTGGGCCGATIRMSANIDTFPGYGGDAGAFFGSWHHFVFQKNRDHKQIWLDGKLFLESRRNNAPLPSAFTIIGIGSNAGGGSNTRGDLDDFAVFASALTPDEIGKLFSGTPPDQVRPITVAGAKFTKFAKNADGSITIEWTGGGTLQAAGAVTGPWQDVPGAASPYTFKPAGAALFGRIKN